MILLSLTVNGRPVSAPVEPRTHLADFLRESQNLTGTHIGCEHGVCGACTLLIDGSPARSCITLAIACQNSEITSIEGLDEDEITVELRAAFKEHHGLQCGYCTPGMIVSARDVVLRHGSPSENDIRVAMSGNLCRCTGYVGIVKAIQAVATGRRQRGIGAVPDGGRTVLGPVGSGRAGAMQVSGEVKRSAATAVPKAADAAPPATGWTPQNSFAQSFTVAHPVDRVWAFFSHIEEVASCLPGATLEGAPVNGHVEGQIRVRVGPIVADFRGVAEIERDENARSGRISGSGRDRRSGSTTRGRVSYAVRPAERPEETLVELSIGYTLTGMLAQFGRSGLVEDVAGRLIKAFAANLEARLRYDAGESGGEAPAPAREVNAGSMMLSIIAARLRGLFSRLFDKH